MRRTGGEDRREDRPSMYFSVEAPDGSKVFPIGPTGYESRWICGKEKYNELQKNGLLEWKKNEKGWQIYQKFYLENRTKRPGNLWVNVEGNKKATRSIRDIFDREKVFDYPKPLGIIKDILVMSVSDNDLVLDFFSGSATTAHAVMQLNAEDGGNRKFIMVQLPEETDEKSEAYKAGYKNICEIGKERIRRAGDKIVQETGKTDLDIGFRVLKVDDSNMQDVYYKPSELKQADLLSSIDNIKADRTPLDLLFGVMVEWGVSLSLPLQEVKVGENTIHIVGDNDLVACFDKNVSTATITKMAELKPIRVVFRDSCFEKDDEKINMFEIFKTICHWDDKQAKDNVRVM